MALAEAPSACQAQGQAHAQHLTSRQQVWELRVISPVTRAQSSGVTQWRKRPAPSFISNTTSSNSPCLDFPICTRG